jgi:hypothetical protein
MVSRNSADRSQFEDGPEMMSSAVVRGAVEISIRVDCQTSLRVGAVSSPSGEAVDHGIAGPVGVYGEDRSAARRAVGTSTASFRSAINHASRRVVEQVRDRIGTV